jgi:hypothetical protein
MQRRPVTSSSKYQVNIPITLKESLGIVERLEMKATGSFTLLVASTGPLSASGVRVAVPFPFSYLY